jgi:predicted RNase H-like nuclease (RuvC/YqgF family)
MEENKECKECEIEPDLEESGAEELKNELERLKEHYAEELHRRDKEIKELKEQNIVIMKSALKQSEKINELTEKLRQFDKKKKL